MDLHKEHIFVQHLATSSRFLASNIQRVLRDVDFRQEQCRMTKAKTAHVERFADADLTGLREDLMKSGLDSWQAADLISSFLAARGYGVSTQDARTAAFRMESVTCSLRCLQEELEKIAYVM
jgi:hypothetical protein